MKHFLLLLLMIFGISSCTKESHIDVKDHSNNSSNQGSLVTLKSGITVKKVNDNIYLGDMMLSKRDYIQLEETGSLFREEDYKDPSYEEVGIPVSPTLGLSVLPNEFRAFGLNPILGKFWSMLRYRFSTDLQDWQKQSIVNTMKYMESVTNVRFYDANDEPTVDPKYGFEYPYVEFTPSESNSSYVGMQGGKTDFETGKL